MTKTMKKLVSLPSGEDIGSKLAQATNIGLAAGRVTLSAGNNVARGMLGFLKNVGKAYIEGVRKPLSPEITELANRMLAGETVEADLPNGYHVKVVNREVIDVQEVK